MKCPRCETTTLDERDRDGITVDACSGCRGLWLDRGELEKLIARATREIEEMSGQRAPAERPAAVRPPAPPQQSYRQDDPYRDRRERDSRYDRDHDHRDPRHRHHKKRTFIDILGDVFD